MIGVAGAGAFGTALAVVLAAAGREVRLWARDPAQRQRMREARETIRLPGVTLPKGITIVDQAADLAGASAVLLAMPMQALRGFLAQEDALLGVDLVACCKGIDLVTLHGPAEVMAAAGAKEAVAVLTGPSFAADIARGLPTALTLATTSARAEALQQELSTPTLRLYRTSDVIGAQLGGALKNVIAIGAGIVVGAGLGESARAALVTRGYSEMVRLAMALGARPETLSGLSGLGDLILTSSSPLSRNFSHGVALGAGKPAAEATVEGLATARAVVQLARQHGVELPVAGMVARLVTGEIELGEAVRELMSRPLKQE